MVDNSKCIAFESAIPNAYPKPVLKVLCAYIPNHSPVQYVLLE